MPPTPFAGIFFFDGNCAKAAGLLRGVLNSSGPAAAPLSPVPGLALAARSSCTKLPGHKGSWLHFESPDIALREAAASYRKAPASFPSGLRGEFAFALHDADAGTFMLGADRFADMPVYYTLFPGGIAWADDPGPLSRLPGVDYGIDPRAVDRYMTMRYVPSPFTLYKGVRKLPPASILSVRGGGLSVRRYWEPPMDEDRYSSMREAAEALHQALLDAVKFRLGGVKRAAAMVSGGMDSSSMSALVVRCGIKLSTFTLGVPGREWDYSEPGRVLAEAVGSRHTYMDYGEPDAERTLAMAASYPEPQSDQCALPLWLCAEKMRGCGEVMFSGDGGDENFGGYNRARLMLNMVWEHNGPELETLLGKAVSAGGRISPAKLDRIRSATGNRLDTIYSELTRLYFGDTGDFYHATERRALYTRDLFLSLRPDHETSAEAVRKIFTGTFGRSWMSRITLPDLCLFHPECTGPRCRATAARAGMRMVLPLNDHKLVELARRIPEKWKLPPGTLARNKCKLILRKAMERELPRAITNGNQRGFAAPAGCWLKGPLNRLFRDTLLSSDAKTSPFFRRKTVERLLAEHVSGKKDRNAELWDLLMLELWLRTH